MRDENTRAFRITVDDQEPIVAGLRDGALVSVHIVQMKDGTHSLHIGGLTDADANGISYHVRWGNHTLQVKDTLTVEVLTTDQTDEPIRRYRSDADVQESPYTDEEWHEMDRQEYLRLKEIFEVPSTAPQPKP